VPYAAAGLDNDDIAARLDTPRQIVSKWRKRFFRERMAGLSRIGRPALFPPSLVVAHRLRGRHPRSRLSKRL